MSDRIRGAIAVLVGGFAWVQSYLLFRAERRDWRMWVEVVAGTVLLGLGLWRLLRRPSDPMDPPANLLD